MTTMNSHAPITNEVSSPLQFDSIESCISSFSSGHFLVVLDDASRENEGDLIIAAEDMTPSKMSFMIRYTSGLICCPLTNAIADELDLPLMVASKSNEDPNGTSYTVSVDSNADGVTTGISATDRSRTCTDLAKAGMRADGFRRPGHVFPLRARDGGARVRRGHTEAGVEFCRLAGKREVAVISEIVEDGETDAQGKWTGGESMLRAEGCMKFAKRWGLKICTVEALVEYLNRRHGDGGGQNMVNGHT